VVLVTALPLGLLALVTSGRAQVSYAIKSGELIVETGDVFVGRRRILLADVISSRAVELGGGTRRMGTALPGYCVGRFSYVGLGTVWQATDCSRRAVVLATRGGDAPIVLTPPDRTAFLAQLAQQQETTVVLPPPSSGTLSRVLLGLACLVAVSVGLLVALLLRGPSRMRYRLEASALEVQTMFRTRRWSTVGWRARRHRPKVTLRLAGTAAPGYYTGLFRADGRTTRIYATQLDDGVLIEGPARLFLSPEDPEAFLTELRRAGVVVDAGPPSRGAGA